jgi:DNA transposition AAA+ family ATPase
MPNENTTTGGREQELEKYNGQPLPQKIKLDDPSIDAVVQAYPDELHEPIRWLAAWTRVECKGRLDILLERAKKAGFKKSRNYFYQVFTGRYFRTTAEGETPEGQVQNFLQIAEKLRGSYLVAQRAGKISFVETGTYKRIAEYIDAKRMPDTVCKFGVIIGPTGAQKSASFDHYVELNNHGKTVRVEAPARPKISTFINDLAMRYGAHLRDSSMRKLQIISESVRNDRCIIIDNAQRLHRPDDGHDQPIFHWLQKLQDDTNCTIVLSFTPDQSKFLTGALDKDKLYFEQFEGRVGGRENFLELDEYTPAADLIQIAESFGFTKPDARQAIKTFDRLARRPGRIRILFDALQRAKRIADRRKEPINIDHLVEARPDLAKTTIIS